MKKKEAEAEEADAEEAEEAEDGRKREAEDGRKREAEAEEDGRLSIGCKELQNDLIEYHTSTRKKCNKRGNIRPIF
jgi:hypothetical protein